MKLVTTRRTDYGIRAVVHLATAKARVKTAEIACATRIPQSVLHHVLQGLQRAHLVEGRSSRNGGFTLARPAGEISLLDVVEALEGTFELGECALRGGPCPISDVCAVHATWDSAWKAMTVELAATTISDLAAETVGDPVELGARHGAPSASAG